MSEGLIKSTLDKLCQHVTFDARLAKKLEDFVIEFTTRNAEHQGFFGGNLVGVHRPLFTEDDADRLCDGILGVDRFEIRKAILALRRPDPKNPKMLIPLIDPGFKVATNVIYHLMMYTCHRFLTTKVSKDIQTKGAINAIMIFQIRAITSKIHYDFKWKADEEMAMAVSMSLSKKFSIKNFGTWYAVMLNRAETVIDQHNGVHYKNIIAYHLDLKIVDAITDTQGRMKDLIVAQWVVIRKVIESDKRVVSQKSTINVEGETILRDLIRAKTDYLNYILSTVLSEEDFVRSDVVETVTGLTISAKPEPVTKALKKLVELAQNDIDGTIERFVRETAIYSYDILYKEYGNSTVKPRLPIMLLKLRGSFGASKGKADELMYLRNEGERIAYLALKSTNKSLIASVRTAILLYIVTRMMMKGKV